MLRTALYIFIILSFTGCGTLNGPKERDINLTLIPHHENDDLVLAVFRNISREPRTIAKPIDGSFRGWSYPIYNLKTRALEGKLDEIGYCGMVDPFPEQIESYVITLAPGDSTTINIPLDRIGGPGVYQIWLEYDFRPDEETAIRRGEHWPVRVWRGRLRSKRLKIYR